MPFPTSETRRKGRIAGLIFALVWLSCVWFGSWEWNPNNATRLFASIAIVEDGEATIDRFAALTVDKARFGDHHYLDKAPGVSLMAVPAVWFATVTGETSRYASLSPYDPVSGRFLRLRLKLATATTTALLTALAAALLFLIGRTLGGSMGAGAFAAIGFALGTPMWGWSTTLFGHAPVAALFVIAIWAVWRGTAGERPSLGHAALAGGALGWAVVIEYPAALEGAAIGVWALWRLRRAPTGYRWRAIAAAALPALAAGLILAAYNQFAFGTPFRLGYQGVVGFEGMQQGLFGLTYPKPRVLYEVVLGRHRGLIWIAPVLVLGLAGLVRLAWTRASRDIGVMALSGMLIVLVYNAAYFYWDGGNSTGPRHAVPAIAFLALGLAPGWAMARHAAARVAAVALLALSVAINLAVASAEIASGGKGDFPLFSDVIADRFRNGELRTLPSEWLGWSPWEGLALYLLIAALIGGGIVRTVARGESG